MYLHEAFHDDLASKGACQSTVLTGVEEGRERERGGREGREGREGGREGMYLHETFHDDLASKGACQGTILTRC